MKLNETNARFAVVKTAFHNGGTLSFHISLEYATKKARAFRGSCMCGCCKVVPVTEEAREEMWNTKNPDPCAYPRYPYRYESYDGDGDINEIALYHEIPHYGPSMDYGTICR